MKPEVLARFQSAQDFRTLAKDVVGLCESFGPVRSYECVRFVDAGNENLVLCFIELETEAQQVELVRGLGALTFGNGVCLKIPMQAGAARAMDTYSGSRPLAPVPAVASRAREA